MKRISEWLKAWLPSMMSRPVAEERKIRINEDGFEVRSDKEIERAVKWERVRLIDAFKRDLFTVDLICLRFYEQGEGLPVEVNEEMDGFGPLVDALPMKFEGFDQAWWDKVAKPAFATNLTELWTSDSPI